MKVRVRVNVNIQVVVPNPYYALCQCKAASWFKHKRWFGNVACKFCKSIYVPALADKLNFQTLEVRMKGGE